MIWTPQGKPSVLVTVPNTGMVHRFVAATVTAMHYDDRVTLEARYPMQRPYENNMNGIIRKFLEGDWDFWVNIDSDNPPLKNPLDLVGLDLDLVGMPTPIWSWDGNVESNPIMWNAFRWIEKEGCFKQIEETNGLQEVDAIGSGAFVCARRVLQHTDLQKGAFLRVYDEHGEQAMGCDLAFSRRVTKAGWRIWAHFDYPSRHYVRTDITQVAEATHGFIQSVVNKILEEEGTRRRMVTWKEMEGMYESPLLDVNDPAVSGQEA